MKQNLLDELRRQLLWHCTGKYSLGQILADGRIRVSDGGIQRWEGRPHACQFLGAVCLFDFNTPSLKQVGELHFLFPAGNDHHGI
jgi:hypothetical protein